jgi:hypothetical protein
VLTSSAFAPEGTRKQAAARGMTRSNFKMVLIVSPIVMKYAVRFNFLVSWGMLIGAILFTLILGTVIIFAFPQFSPIPYYPSNMKDKALILNALRLTNRQTVIDLGAGDGAVIYEAAKTAYGKGLDTDFIALELNPVLVLILHLRRLLHPNKQHIRVRWGDMFKLDYRTLAGDPERSVTFYLYISPWLIEQVVARTKKQVPRARYVSYYYPIRSMKQKQRKQNGIHAVHVYG